MMIDFHTHCFPDELYERAVKKLSEATGQPPFFDGSVGGLKKSMHENGIDCSVVCNIATNAKQNKNVTAFAISLAKEEGLVPFGSIHPEYNDFLTDLAELKSAGVKGLKFHSEYQSFVIDDKAVYPIYEAAVEMGFVMIFHMGIDPGFKEVRARPSGLARVVRDFPKGQFIAGHIGGYGFWEETLETLAGKNVYLETSFGLNIMPRELAMKFIAKHGSERILFGSDAPWEHQGTTAKQIAELNLSSSAYENIMYENARLLLALRKV